MHRLNLFYDALDWKAIDIFVIDKVLDRHKHDASALYVLIKLFTIKIYALLALRQFTLDAWKKSNRDLHRIGG